MMDKQVEIDLTTLYGSIKGLNEYLNVSEKMIRNYKDFCNGDYSVDDFLNYINVSEQQLLSGDLKLSTLHVTTNNDNCSSIKKYGLVSLQKAITIDTPLGNYLKQKGILIDLEEKRITFNGNTFDIGRKFEKFNMFADDDENVLTMIIYKLFEDCQVNSFFGSDNVLDYGGYCSDRPEFLYNLAELLKDQSIIYDWERDKKTKCYVIKFNVPLSNIIDFTFFDEMDFALKKHEIEYLDQEEIEIKKRKWVVHQLLANVFDENYLREYTCFVKPELSIPPKDIIKIYTPEEYLEAYNI
ncbi:hypothetical protein [Mangrovibacillus cuniculi]|uniref:Uncharacterized protein n=1 Tax=Mangrovibacillus cuniculi TaxID=2593652 RepID=A0A7S8CCQ0_9BACI|nr:hypothetical protein [Mangrovibacillus cuniculi]QPC47368.1 hypothetical protein G8O30_10615 [Mangrovibacillus cuniculi]